MVVEVKKWIRIVVFSWGNKGKELDDDYESMSHRVHIDFRRTIYIPYLEDFTRMRVISCGLLSKREELSRRTV